MPRHQTQFGHKRKWPLFILGIILLILAGWWFWVPLNTFWESFFSPDKTMNLKLVNQEEIDQIVIESQGEILELTKNDQWWIKDGGKSFLLNQNKVEELLTVLNNITPLEIVTEKADKHYRYEVTPELALQIKLFTQGKLQSHFFVGKYTKDFSGQYVRLGDQEKVISIKEKISPSAQLDRDFWLELQLVDFSSEDITELTFKESEQKVELKKEEGNWRNLSDETVDPDLNQIESNLATLANLKARELAINIDAEESETAEATASLKIFISTGLVSKTIFVGKKMEDFYFVRMEGDSRIFKVNDFVIEGIKVFN